MQVASSVLAEHVYVIAESLKSFDMHIAVGMTIDPPPLVLSPELSPVPLYHWHEPRQSDSAYDPMQLIIVLLSLVISVGAQKSLLGMSSLPEVQEQISAGTQLMASLCFKQSAASSHFSVELGWQNFLEKNAPVKSTCWLSSSVVGIVAAACFPLLHLHGGAQTA